MLNKAHLLFLLIVLLSPTLASAQGGSNYSIIGIGDINSDGNAAYSALGGTSIAMPLTNAINYTNPALWSKAKLTTLLAGYRFQQHINEQNGLSLKQNNGQINGVSGIFVVDTSMGIAVSFGLRPYSSINYLLSTDIEMQQGDLTLKGMNRYGGVGGLTKGYIGASTNIYAGLSLGASVEAIFGKIQRESSTSFQGDFTTYDYLQVARDVMSGYSYKLGAYYDGIKSLGLGIYIESFPDMNIDRDRIYTNYPLYNDTIISRKIPVSLPNTLGFGASYRSGKFLLGADYSMSDFSDFNYEPAANTEFTTSNRMSFGVNRLGNINPNADYLDKIDYKAGLKYQKLYYSVSGEDIFDYSLSFGMRMPLSGTGAIDAAVELGRRGTNDSGLMLEYYGKLSFGISIGETWFKPFRREY